MSRPVHVFVSVILAAAVLFGAGCGAEEAVAVDLKISEAAVHGDTVTIAGTTDLPDGASLIYSFSPFGFESYTTVAGGKWSVEASISEMEDQMFIKTDIWRREGISFWISFFPLTYELDRERNPSTEEIYEVYGKGGVNIADGPNVETFGSGDEIIKRVVAEIEIPVD